MTKTLAEELTQITKTGRKNIEKANEAKQKTAKKAEDARRKEARKHGRELYPEIVAEIKSAAARGETNYRRFFGESNYYLWMLEEIVKMLKADGIKMAEAHFLKATGSYGMGHYKYGYIPNDTTVIDVTWE